MALIVGAEAETGRGALWIGDKKASKSHEWLQSRSISAIVNVTADLPNVHDDVDYHTLRCDDAIEDAATLDGALDGALTQVESWLAGGRNVLVHCHAGRSRSATLVLAHLMQSRRLPLTAALELVLARRPVLPNRGFFAVLERRQSEWCSPDAPPPPEYRVLTQRFVSALSDAAVELAEKAQREIAQKGRPVKSLAERLALQEALNPSVGEPRLGPSRPFQRHDDRPGAGLSLLAPLAELGGES